MSPSSGLKHASVQLVDCICPCLNHEGLIEITRSFLQGRLGTHSPK